MMLYHLKPLFTGERQSLPVDCELDFSGLEIQGAFPFTRPVRVRGEISVAADTCRLKAAAEFVYDGFCDRCLTALSRPSRLLIEHILVTSLAGEDDSELILVDDDRLLLDELVREDLILSLPAKNLCRGDCRGLCPLCGKELNAGLCGCRGESADPRLAGLKRWTQTHQDSD